MGESLNDALPKDVMVNAVTNLAVLVFTVVIVVAMAGPSRLVWSRLVRLLRWRLVQCLFENSDPEK